MAIPGASERWENWMQFVQSRMVPSFTPMGFKMIPTPSGIQERFETAMAEELVNGWDHLSVEPGVRDSIYNSNNLLPKFIQWKPLFGQVHRELLPLHEEWAGR